MNLKSFLALIICLTLTIGLKAQYEQHIYKTVSTNHFKYNGEVYASLAALDYLFRTDNELSADFDKYLLKKQFAKKWKIGFFSSLAATGIAFFWIKSIRKENYDGISNEAALALYLGAFGLGGTIITSVGIMVNTTSTSILESKLLSNYNQLVTAKSGNINQLYFGISENGIGLVFRF